MISWDVDFSLLDVRRGRVVPFPPSWYSFVYSMRSLARRASSALPRYLHRCSAGGLPELVETGLICPGARRVGWGVHGVKGGGHSVEQFFLVEARGMMYIKVGVSVELPS
jgi:hypothetical protein